MRNTSKSSLKKVVVLLLVITVALLVSCSTKDFGAKSAKSSAPLVIRLKENPTTGYQWTFSIDHPETLSLLDDSFDSDLNDNNLVGVGGVHTFRFTPLKAGTGTIKFVYERSWEKTDSDITLTFNYTVSNDMRLTLNSIPSDEMLLSATVNSDF